MSLEGIPGGQFEPIETVRPSINQEVESHFDKAFEDAMTSMDAKQYFRVPEVINHLDANRIAKKEALAEALNIDGYGWMDIATRVTDDESQRKVSEMILAWAKEVERSADKAAISNAGHQFCKELENL